MSLVSSEEEFWGMGFLVKDEEGIFVFIVLKYLGFVEERAWKEVNYGF